MSKKVPLLRFADHVDGSPLELPLSVLMQTVFLGGNKGAGKTSAMKRQLVTEHDEGVLASPFFFEASDE